MKHFVMRNEILIISILHAYFASVIMFIDAFLRGKYFFCHYITMDSLLLFLHIGETSIATSKMSLQPCVGGKSHLSNCHVRCGGLVMCCLRILTKCVYNHYFEINYEFVKNHHNSLCLCLQALK